jgi:hypothetical protein
VLLRSAARTSLTLIVDILSCRRGHHWHHADRVKNIKVGTLVDQKVKQGRTDLTAGLFVSFAQSAERGFVIVIAHLLYLRSKSAETCHSRPYGIAATRALALIFESSLSDHDLAAALKQWSEYA